MNAKEISKGRQFRWDENNNLYGRPKYKDNSKFTSETTMKLGTLKRTIAGWSYKKSWNVEEIAEDVKEQVKKRVTELNKKRTPEITFIE